MGFHGGQTESCAIFRLRDAALLKATILSHYFVGLLDIQRILTIPLFLWFILYHRNQYFAGLLYTENILTTTKNRC